MVEGVVPRTLTYVGLLFTLCLASTFVWWAAAGLARPAHARIRNALACSMRLFAYSIFLLCILVLLKSLNLAPADPRSTLFSWIHLGATLLVSVFCAWRSFGSGGRRLVLLLGTAWGLGALAVWLAASAFPAFAALVRFLPRYLTAA